MALPTSREQTFGPKKMTVSAAFLNTLQTWIKNLWDGKHAAERIVIPCQHAQRTANVTPQGDTHLNSSGAGQAWVRLPVVRGDRITSFGVWAYKPAGVSVSINLYRVTAAGVRSTIGNASFGLDDRWNVATVAVTHTVADDELMYLEFTTGGVNARCGNFHWTKDRL